MATTEKLALNAVKNVCLSCFLCFITGFLYSLGVFSTSVEEAANPPGSLDGVWSAGMALISFFCIPFMFFAGVYLSEGPHSAGSLQESLLKTSRARLLSAAASLSYGLLAIAGYGVATSSALFVQLSFIPVGVGMGLFYLESMELLAVWVPRRPGLAVGIGQMMFGLGSILSSSVFHYLLQNYTVSNALYIAAAILSLPAAAATPFLQWPPPGHLRPHETSETDALIQIPTPLSWKQLVYLPSFWMYVITIFCLQSGYALIAYYFKIGQTFDRDLSTLVTSFQAATVAGTLFRPLIGAFVDVLKTDRGFFSLGSKNMILLLFAGQTVSFLALVPVSWTRSYAGFAGFAGTILAIFAAGSCCAPLLAREQFGAVNSSVVFGAGGSISMGLGETVAVVMMAAVKRSSSKTDAPSEYQAFYVLSVLWSVSGLAMCLLLRAQDPISDSRSGSIESPKISHLEIAPLQTHTRSDSYITNECSYYGAIEPPLRSLKVI